MSKFDLGKYQIEISDKYESEEILWNGNTCIEVKQKNNPGYSARIFFGVMPGKETPKRELCSSHDTWWTALCEEWLPKDDIGTICGPRPDSKYEHRDGWYDIIIGHVNNSSHVRRIARQLDGKDMLNFTIGADTKDSDEHKFIEDLADTTKAVTTG